MKPKILILCTGNSCRSQMAHGWLTTLAGDKAEIFSAGVVTHGVNPHAIKVMSEAGIDISGHTSNNVNEYVNIEFDHIITVCDHAKENCPYLPGKANRIHQNFEDPANVSGTAEQVLPVYRRVRDQLKEFCERFAEAYL